MGMITRKRVLKKKKLGIGVFETRQEDKTHYENAFITALNTVTMINIDIKAMIQYLTKEQLNDILINWSANKCKTQQIEQLSKCLKEMQNLCIVEEKIHYAQSIIIEHFKECFAVKYCKPNGQINYALFITHIDNQIEKISNDEKMDDTV